MCSAVFAAADLDPLSARFRSLDSSNGLSQDTALAMAEDRHGFIWIGTQDGLNRYDGHEVVTFRAGRNGGTLGSNWIESLCIATDHTLWVGTSAGLFRLDEGAERFQRYSSPHHPNSGEQFIYQLLCEATGQVWVAGAAGLAQVDAASAKLRMIEEQPPPADARIRSVVRDLAGRLWLGSFDGLRCLDPKAGYTSCGRVESLDGMPINVLLLDPNGQLWVGTDRAGLFRVDPATRQAEPMFNGANNVEFPHRIVALHFDPATGLWLGTELGAIRVLDYASDRPSLQVFAHRPHDQYSAGLGRVRSFLSSADGSLWLGSWEGGASRLHPRYRRFLSFAGETLGLDAAWQPSVYSLTEHQDQLYIGTPQGAYAVDRDQFQLRAVPGSEERAVHSMVSDGKQLWLGTYSGLYRHSSDQAFQAVDPSGPLANSRIARLATDGEHLWAAAALQGVFALDVESGKILAEHRFAGTVNHLDLLNEDWVLVSASDGLYWFDRNDYSLRHRTEVSTAGEAGKLPGRPSGFFRDQQGRLWVSAYGAGLVRLQLPADNDPAKLQLELVAGEEQLINLGINSVTGDHHGQLWLASDRGITRFNPQNHNTRHFDDSDGALARGYYFAARQTLGNGLIAFGSKHGLTVFDPAQDFSQAAPRPPLVTSLERQGEAIRPASQQPGSPLPQAIHLLPGITLPPGWGRNLLFKIASPSFVHPKELRYRYRLDGFDSEWLEVDAQRRLITYTNLPPGEYRLQLQALTRSGLGSQVRTVTLSIQPHWWQSTPAMILAVLLAIGLLSLLYRLRVRHLAQQRAALELLIKQRTESLQRAHQQAEQSLQVLKSTQAELVRAEKLSALGQLVAGVAHEVNTPLGVAVTAISHITQQLRSLQGQVQSGRMTKREFELQIVDTIEGARLVERNLDRAAELIRSFKQISVDRSSDQRRQFALDEMLAQLLQSLKILWRHRPIEFVIECPPQLTFDSYPGALGQVLTNLTQNALLHAYADTETGRLSIRCRALDDEWVEIRYADDGCGISAEHLPKVFEPFYTTRRNDGGTGLGLHIVHNLVNDVLGGRLRMRSEPGQGTEITIEIPRNAPRDA